MKSQILTIIIGLATMISAKHPFPPMMLVQPPTTTQPFIVAKPGESPESFRIECEASSEPAPIYFWKKNGRIFNNQHYDYDNRILSLPGNGTLIFRIPSAEDEGTYQCFAGNQYGIASSNSVILKKSYLDDFETDRTFTLSGNENEPFGIACNQSTGWPMPRVIWQLYFPENNTRTLITENYNPRITIDPAGILWFSSLEKTDESTDFYYTCGIFLDYQNIYREINKYKINVIESNNKTRYPPTKLYLSKSVETISGKNIELFCIYGGNPMPQLRWEKGMRKIESSDKYKFRNNGRSLRIIDVDVDDQAIYSCIIDEISTYNIIGLFVNVLPHFTVEPKFVHGWENETVTIQCEAHGRPNPEIKWIFNGQLIDQSMSNEHRKIDVNSVVIKNLSKKDSGNYGCNATNSVGYVYKDVYVHVIDD